jgi:DNA polymerase-3 subunit beta
MKISIARKVLLDRFEVAASFAPKRSNCGVLTHVFMDASDGILSLEANDTETGISVSTPCEVNAPGKALAPRDRLLAILNESACETVDINVEDGSLHIKCGKAKFRLPTSDPSEFPRNKIETDGPTATVKFDDLHQAVSKTAYATDPDSSRFALGGVLFAFDGGTVDVVGTDGRRLSTVAFQCEGDLKRQFIVPAKSLQLLCRTRCSGDVVVCSQHNAFVVYSEDVRFFAREVEGRYPNWKQVIPSSEDFAKFTVPSRSLTSLFRQASITQDIETRGIDIVLDESQITASCTTQDIGKSFAECDCTLSGATEHTPISIKIDSRFMLDFLKSISGEQEIVLHAKSSTTPMLLVDGQHRYVIMPMAST